MLEDYGILNEQRLEKELSRRNLPYKHRVQLGEYEVDFLVGSRIVVEVDGYVHLTKKKMKKDREKEKALTALGFTILRITGTEVCNQGFLKEFSAKIQAFHERNSIQRKKLTGRSLKASMPQSELLALRERLELEGKKKEKEKRAESRAIKKEKLTDEELFLQELEKLEKYGRK